MNNSAMQFNEPQPDDSERKLTELRKMEQKNIKIIEALQEVHNTKAWSSLKELLFDNLVETLTKEIQTEARREKPDSNKLNRIAGKLEWAEKYADLIKLAETQRDELMRIRHLLYGK